MSAQILWGLWSLLPHPPPPGHCCRQQEDRLQSLAFHTRRPEPLKCSNFKIEGRFHGASVLGGASQSKNLASPQHRWAHYTELKEWRGLESHAQVLERHTSTCGWPVSHMFNYLMLTPRQQHTTLWSLGWTGESPLWQNFKVTYVCRVQQTKLLTPLGIWPYHLKPNTEASKKDRLSSSR